MVETNDEWIRSRTGIRQRHVVNDEESTATLAKDAALNALRVANLNPADVELIIVSPRLLSIFSQPLPAWYKTASGQVMLARSTCQQPAQVLSTP
jgi:3-oxoacyl-[acyl-carrier-protein] synthase-3